jgi:hypothetical protein
VSDGRFDDGAYKVLQLQASQSRRTNAALAAKLALSLQLATRFVCLPNSFRIIQGKSWKTTPKFSASPA